MLRDFISRLIRSNDKSETPQNLKKAPAITVVGQGGSQRETIEPSHTLQSASPYSSISSAADWLNAPQNSHVPSDLLHPEKEGLQPVSASELMDANRAYIEQALQSFTGKHYIPDFDTHLLEFIRRVAHWMGPFPASRGHHHSNRGGLFTHSIGVALSSLHMSVGKNVTTHSTPRERDADVLAWQLICFICGMIHDIGKLNTTGKIYALSVTQQKNAEGAFVSSAAPVYSLPWQPMVEGFEGWATGNKVQSYFIDFDLVETLPHKDFTVRYVMALIPRPLLAYIYNSADVVRSLFEDFIRNPESASQTPIFVVVRDADHMNVAQSMDPRRRPGSAEMGSLIIRRFNEFASEALWNLPSSAFIYAHVERITDDGNRYYGMPFFVASEHSINEFIHYLTTKPLLGVSFGSNIREIVFKTLESTYVMNRTIQPFLPEQIALDELQEYVPASNASLRFRARNVDSVIRPIGDKHADAIIELPVIPINLRPTASVMLTAPTLSFVGVPISSTAAAVPLMIENGKIKPADPTLVSDVKFMGNLKSDLGMGPDEAQALSEVKPSKPTPVPDAPATTSAKFANFANMAPDAGAKVSKPMASEGEADPQKTTTKTTKKPASKAPAKPTPAKPAAPASEKAPKAPSANTAKTKDKAKDSAPPKTAKQPADSKPKDAPAPNSKSTKTKPKPAEANAQGSKATKADTKKDASPTKRSKNAGAQHKTTSTEEAPSIAAAPANFGHSSASIPHPPENAAEWMQAYRTLFDMPPETSKRAFWAVLWLYLQTINKHSVTAVEDGKGGFGLRGTSIPKTFRGEIIAALQDAQILVTFVTDYWPNSAVRLDDEKFANLYTVSTPEEGITVVDLGPDAAALIHGVQAAAEEVQGTGEEQS